jgi:hypothetical protein
MAVVVQCYSGTVVVVVLGASVVRGVVVVVGAVVVVLGLAVVVVLGPVLVVVGAVLDGRAELALDGTGESAGGAWVPVDSSRWEGRAFELSGLYREPYVLWLTASWPDEPSPRATPAR